MFQIKAAAVAAALIAGSAHGAVVINGSFEVGTNPGSTFSTPGVGATDVTGWTISQASIDYIGGYWQASDGVRSIDLNGDRGPATLSQTLTLTPGTSYTLTFDLSANPDFGTGINPFDVQVGLTGIAPTVFSYNLTGANSLGNMQWASQSLTFTAVNAATVLSFTSLQGGACCYGPALDNVSVTAVPEPQTWALLIAGFGMIGIAARRRTFAAA